jgi:hypothetical protein
MLVLKVLTDSTDHIDHSWDYLVQENTMIDPHTKIENCGLTEASTRLRKGAGRPS